MAEEPDFSEICFVGGDLTEFNAKRFGQDVRRLDISFNVISKLKGLEVCAENLEELVLDNNHLETLEVPTTFPKLHTLSINKNKISNLTKLLDDLKSKAPVLRYLSLLGNPSCPDQLSNDLVDDCDYQLYRYHVLYHIRTLKFLDHRPVSSHEAAEAKKSLYGNLKLGSRLMKSSKPSTTRSKQGKRKYKYLGKNSEGNRFIKDNDL